MADKPWYHCLRCDVFGVGVRCWNCNASTIEREDDATAQVSGWSSFADAKQRDEGVVAL